MDQEQFSTSQEERWCEISEFPGYSVTDRGRVLNDKTGFYIKTTRNTRGNAIVGLMNNGIQAKRSLVLLVANAFVRRPSNVEFNTPINLDGDKMNNHYMNIKWRPLWFARKYVQQFDDNHTTFQFPVEDVETGELYKNSMHAAMVNGVLDSEIYSGMMNNHYVWPTGQVFREALER